MTEHAIADLAALTGLSVRTIRYYLAEGLVPPAGREGRGARYPEATLARLRLIARLRDAHLPLAEIRRRLEALSDGEILALASGPAAPAPEESALDYVRSLLGGPAPAPDAAWPASIPGFDLGPDVLAAGPEPSPLRLEVPSFLRRAHSRDLADRAPSAPAAPAEARREPAEPVLGSRSQWERIALSADIELHVRRPLSRRDNRMVERLVAFARQLRGEDTP